MGDDLRRAVIAGHSLSTLADRLVEVFEIVVAERADRVGRRG